MPNIGGLILAAGGSTRLGQPKQLLEFGGETLVHAAVRATQEAGCAPVWVVTGRERVAVEGALADLAPTFTHNEAWSSGMGSSIRRGVGALDHSISAVVILVCDQPAVDAEVVRALWQLHLKSRLPIVAAAYAGTLGIPALFARECFPELVGISDDRGAKSVIQADPSRVAIYDFPDGELDIDSPDDLARWRQGFAKSKGSN